ncbi:hypothetical protein CR513_16139, partial [Mucuna pruriens]
MVATENLYNILIGKLTSTALEAVVSIPHLVMKFPTFDQRIVTINVDQRMAQQCYINSLKVVASSPSKRKANIVSTKTLITVRSRARVIMATNSTTLTKPSSCFDKIFIFTSSKSVFAIASSFPFTYSYAFTSLTSRFRKIVKMYLEWEKQ